jgi:tetratricopeptide (TPR) repeat protein
MRPTICLNMIVRDESKIIIDTLENLCSYINFDYWVICDTGSLDDTKEKIIEFFEKKDISGELIEHEWKDFAHNRTLALDAAYNKTDYLFLFDADDTITGDFKLPTDLSKDKYLCKFGTDSFSYNRPNLLSNRKKWKFIGVLHEFLSNIEPINGEELINGDYHIEIGVHGARANNPNKYLDDALLLEKAFITEDENGNDLKNRYAFYCAQSYKDCGKLEKSIEWYLKVLELDNWSQEKYYSCLQLGYLYFKLNEEDKAIKILSRASEYDCERIDCIAVLMSHYYSEGNHLLVNALYNKYKNYSSYNYENKLFLNKKAWIEFEYYNSISAYYVHDYISGYNSCKKLLEYREKIEITNSNIKFYL